MASRNQVRRQPAQAGARRQGRAPDPRGGYNFADRYPWIVEAARKVRQTRFVIDGEAVVLGVDGIADFNALHSRRHDDEVQLYTFNISWPSTVTTCVASRTRGGAPS